jgi:hypothetical protein
MTERRRTQVLILKLLAYSGVVSIILGYVLSSESSLTQLPALQVVGLQVAGGVALHLLSELVGYRVPAIPAGTPPEEARHTAVVAYAGATARRFALCHSLAIVSIALAFLVTQGPFLTYLVGAVISGALVVYHNYPWERPVARTRDSLERDGGRSFLMESFGFESEAVVPAPRL